MYQKKKQYKWLKRTNIIVLLPVTIYLNSNNYETIQIKLLLLKKLKLKLNNFLPLLRDNHNHKIIRKCNNKYYFIYYNINNNWLIYNNNKKNNNKKSNKKNNNKNKSQK